MSRKVVCLKIWAFVKKAEKKKKGRKQRVQLLQAVFVKGYHFTKKTDHNLWSRICPSPVLKELQKKRLEEREKVGYKVQFLRYAWLFCTWNQRFSTYRTKSKMTRIRKRTGPSMVDQLPKQMAQILYDTLIQETLRSSAENTAMVNGQNPSTEGELVKVMKPEENSTWRVGLHKRTDTNMWRSRTRSSRLEFACF